MFSTQELSLIDRAYFDVLELTDNLVVLKSKNTRHGWHIFRPNNEFYSPNAFIIYHRHENQHDYHLHGYSTSLKSAIKEIKKHDRFQIKVRWKNGRKPYPTSNTTNFQDSVI